MLIAMHDDVTHLRDFYASPLGRVARRIIAHRIRSRWDNVTGMDIAGLGYAVPYLRMFHGEARATVALMPQAQGVVKWPREGPYRSALVPETELPLRDNSVERVLVVHGLEHNEARGLYLREIYRVLMPQGRLIMVVPNRRGAWARLETTPFGHGRPYSLSQLEKFLRQASLEPVGMSQCLFLPPFGFRLSAPLTCLGANWRAHLARFFRGYHRRGDQASLCGYSRVSEKAGLCPDTGIAGINSRALFGCLRGATHGGRISRCGGSRQQEHGLLTKKIVEIAGYARPQWALDHSAPLRAPRVRRPCRTASENL